MIDREKLIAMLDAGSCIIWECKDGKLVMSKHSEYLIDHLIANGVVVREKGEWKKVGKHDWRCTACGIGVPYEDTGHHFCPNCGADMRKGENAYA